MKDITWYNLSYWVYIMSFISFSFNECRNLTLYLLPKVMKLAFFRVGEVYFSSQLICIMLLYKCLSEIGKRKVVYVKKQNNKSKWVGERETILGKGTVGLFSGYAFMFVLSTF